MSHCTVLLFFSFVYILLFFYYFLFFFFFVIVGYSKLLAIDSKLLVRLLLCPNECLMSVTVD